MMPPPRTRRFGVILVAIDFSDLSARALRYAEALTHSGGGRLVALYAVDPLVSRAAATMRRPDTIEQESARDLKGFVRRTLGDPGANVQYLVKTAHPVEAIRDAAQRLHADVVVMGTHGRGGLAKLLMGSTTAGVLRRLARNVVIIPPGCPPPPPAGWPGKTIVAAVGAGPQRRRLLSRATNVAEMFGAWIAVADPSKLPPRTKWRRAGLVILPLTSGSRLTQFTQGGAAYQFVREARTPVLVVSSARRPGHVTTSGRAA